MNESSLFWFVEIIAIIIVVYLCRHSQPPYSRDTMWTTRTVRWEMKINRNVRCEIWRIEKEKKMMIESRKKTRSTYKVQSRCWWWWSKAKMIYFPPLVDKTFSLLVLFALASLLPITAAPSRCHCATERSFRLPSSNNKSQTEWKIALEWSYYSWETRWFILMDFHGILRCFFLTTLSSLGCCEQTNENFLVA